MGEGAKRVTTVIVTAGTGRWKPWRSGERRRAETWPSGAVVINMGSASRVKPQAMAEDSDRERAPAPGEAPPGALVRPARHRLARSALPDRDAPRRVAAEPSPARSSSDGCFPGCRSPSGPASSCFFAAEGQPALWAPLLGALAAASALALRRAAGPCRAGGPDSRLALLFRRLLRRRSCGPPASRRRCWRGSRSRR